VAIITSRFQLVTGSWPVTLQTFPVGLRKKVRHSGNKLRVNCQFVQLREIFEQAGARRFWLWNWLVQPIEAEGEHVLEKSST
jgi:hypothetical protein